MLEKTRGTVNGKLTWAWIPLNRAREDVWGKKKSVLERSEFYLNKISFRSYVTLGPFMDCFLEERGAFPIQVSTSCLLIYVDSVFDQNPSSLCEVWASSGEIRKHLWRLPFLPWILGPGARASGFRVAGDFRWAKRGKEGEKLGCAGGGKDERGGAFRRD